MQQYLQHEHYALWEVIEFGDSYTSPENSPSTTTTSTTSGEKSGRTVTLTIGDMQKKNNDVKARTTLLLSLPDKHQLRFSKQKTAKELWAAILKTFGGNEATKKTKKNLLKHQYRNFRAKGSETLEQTFTKLQVIIATVKSCMSEETANSFYGRQMRFSRLVRHVEKEFSNTEKSSIKTSIVFSIMSWNIAIIHRWKVPGALQRPNGMRL
nr:hypothetical protein [Tanacetum cinerariifolium]